MPGMLSNMFESDTPEGANVQYIGDGSEASETSNVTDAQSDIDLDLDVELTIRAETAVEYQLGEDSGGWSNETELNLDISADALLASATQLGTEDMNYEE